MSKMHGWTHETMDQCAKTFMNQITHVYFNYADKNVKKETIYQLIERYFEIECDVRNRMIHG